MALFGTDHPTPTCGTGIHVISVVPVAVVVMVHVIKGKITAGPTRSEPKPPLDPLQ